jgi:diaminopimelate epimerase
MKFAKYHGTGNDFVMLEDLEDRLTLSQDLVSTLCDRHMGVGADGVIRIAPSADADFFMDYWNADGNVAEMCGNGIRCLAKYVFDGGLTTKTELTVDTRAGVKELTLAVSDGTVSSVRVDMGTPALTRNEIPMVGRPGDTFVDEPMAAGDAKYRATAVSMGNPHLVLIGEADPSDIDLHVLGPALQRHDDFPEQTNVEFVRIVDGVIDVRVWERGSGETMACGTGACASLVAASTIGLVGRKATVRFPGGELDVEWAADDHVYLAGPAVFVFEGEIDAMSIGARPTEVTAG